MNKLFILICILSVELFTVRAQTLETSNKQKGKYFEYNIHEKYRGATPLFETPVYKIPKMIRAKVEMKSNDWSMFSNQFVEEVLKKYLTVEEIRKMLKEGHNWASASMFIYFDYYGNIRSVFYVFNNDLKDILTDEKLYHIHQDLMKFKVDTTGYTWWIQQVRCTKEQEKKVFEGTHIPFFYKSNCP